MDTQGIGLGLPLAKSIVEGQGGVLSVQSRMGKGTVFTMAFPNVKKVFDNGIFPHVEASAGAANEEAGTEETGR